MQQYLVEKKTNTFLILKILLALLSLFATSWMIFTSYTSIPIEFNKEYVIKAKLEESFIKGIGKIVPRNITLISAKDEGVVAKMNVRLGEYVEKGMVLTELKNYSLIQEIQEQKYLVVEHKSKLNLRESELQIREFQLESDLSKARITKKQQQLELSANERLVKVGIVSTIKYKQQEMSLEQSDLEVKSKEKQLVFSKKNFDRQIQSLRSKFDAAQAKLDFYEKRLNDLTIISEVSGIVKEINFSAGEVVRQGQSIFELIEQEQLTAKIQVPQYSISELAIGQLARINTPSGNLDAEVDHIDNVIRNGSISIYLKWQGKTPTWMKIDQSIEANIITNNDKLSLYTSVPENFLLYQSWNIYQISKSNNATKLNVSYSIRKNNFLVFDSHQLKGGDRIFIIPAKYADSEKLPL